MTKVVVDGKEFVAVSETGSVKIVILQRGWVFVGRYSEESDYGILTSAQCLRNWGTSKGLGQIAADGPTKDTKMDAHGTVRFHKLTTVALIDCVDEKWARSL